MEHARVFGKMVIPAPIECHVVMLDRSPGGGFTTRMREDGGEFQPHVGGCFLEGVLEVRLIWTTVLTEGWQPAEPWLALTAIIAFEASCTKPPRTPKGMKKWDSTRAGEP